MNMENNSPPDDRPILLLVDDDAVYCQVLGDALRKRDYEVYIAHDLTTRVCCD